MANNLSQLNSLVANGIVESYPPLVDKKGSYTAQFEHVSQTMPFSLSIFFRLCFFVRSLPRLDVSY